MESGYCYQYFQGEFSKEDAYSYAQQFEAFLPDLNNKEQIDKLVGIFAKEGASQATWTGNVLVDGIWKSEYTQKEVDMSGTSGNAGQPKPSRECMAIGKLGSLRAFRSGDKLNVLILKNILSMVA